MKSNCSDTQRNIKISLQADFTIRLRTVGRRMLLLEPWLQVREYMEVNCFHDQYYHTSRSKEGGQQEIHFRMNSFKETFERKSGLARNIAALLKSIDKYIRFRVHIKLIYIPLSLFNTWSTYRIQKTQSQNKHQHEEEKKFQKVNSPDVGLEPTTLRLRVSCSTD